MTVLAKDLARQLSNLPPKTVPVIVDKHGNAYNVRVRTDLYVAGYNPGEVAVLEAGEPVIKTTPSDVRKQA